MMSHTDVSFYYGYPTHDEDLDSGGGGTICPADIYLVPPSPSDYEDFSATLDDDPLDVWASGTPIDLLPNELLLEIWEASGCNPVVLSWVCHRWREVAISAPGLWTTIRVNNKISNEEAETRLTRSQQCPLRVNIRFYSLHHKADRLHEKMSLLTTLFRTSQRWHSYELALHCDLPSELSNVMFQLPSAPRLVQLVVSCDTMPSSSFPHPLPALTDLELRRDVNLRNNKHLLSGMTSLVIDNIPPEGGMAHHEFQAAMAGCPRLSRFILCGACVDYSLPHNGEYGLISMPSLEYLMLDPGSRSLAYTLPFFATFFRHLSVPALRTLKLSDWPAGDFYELASGVLHPASSFNCPELTTLCLITVGSVIPSGYVENEGDSQDGSSDVSAEENDEVNSQNDDEVDSEYAVAMPVEYLDVERDLMQHGILEPEDNSVRRLIHHFPSIRTLFVGDAGLPEVLLALTCKTSSGEIACPRLHTFKWETLRKYTFPLLLLKPFIEKRAILGYPLAKLRTTEAHFMKLPAPTGEWFWENVTMELYEGRHDEDPDASSALFWED